MENNQISIIKNSLLEIEKLCVDKKQANLYKDVIVNSTNNILFLFLAFRQLDYFLQIHELY